MGSAPALSCLLMKAKRCTSCRRICLSTVMDWDCKAWAVQEADSCTIKVHKAVLSHLLLKATDMPQQDMHACIIWAG